MRLVSTDGSFALLAFGQAPTGIVAIGQAPTGIVAIGQLSRGIFVVGQLAVGLVVVGQAAVGLAAIGQLVLAPTWGLGMIGITGRGKGFVLSLLPRWRSSRPVPVPDLVRESDLLAGTVERGRIAVHRRGGRLLTEGGVALEGEPATDGGGATAEVVREDVADARADFRASARVTRLRVLTVDPPPVRERGHFLAGGLVGSGASRDAPASAAEIVTRLGAWVVLTVAVVAGLLLVASLTLR